MRDQSLGDEAQVALGHRFGPLETISLGPGDLDLRELIVISNVGDDGEVRCDGSDTMRSIAINEQWHTDSSFRETPGHLLDLQGRGRSAGRWRDLVCEPAPRLGGPRCADPRA